MINPKPFDLGPFVSNNFGDRYLFPVNRDSFRSIGAYSIFKKQYGEDLRAEKTLHIVIGTDSGLLPEYIYKNGLPESSRYVFVELPSVIARLRNSGFLQDLPDRIHCITMNQLQAVSKKYEFQNYLYTEKINIWKSMAALDAFLPEYTELYWETRDYIEAFAWQLKIQLGNRDFIIRQLENLDENRVSATCLQNLFQGKTAVLLAGGPSLDEYLPWINTHRDKFVVLAVSRIARRLKEINLTPDIFVSVDPQPLSFDISKEMLYFGEKTLFINGSHVVPNLLSQWQGRSAYVGRRLPWQENPSETFLQVAGPTVTNTALSIVVALGFSTVIFTGVDFCLSPIGLSHSKGSNESQAGPPFGLFDTQVMTNCGKKLFTKRAMAEAIPVMADQVAVANKAGCRVINPAPFAAQIPGVEHLPLDKICFTPLHEPALTTISRALPPESKESRSSFYDKTRQSLLIAEKRLLKIKELSKKALFYNNALFGRNGLKPDFKYKRYMDRIEDTLQDDQLAPFAKMVKEFGLRQFVKLCQPDSQLEWSNEKVEEAAKIYYQAFFDNASALLEIITIAKKRNKLRINEENPRPEPILLTEGWREFFETGRSYIWQSRLPANVFPTDTKDTAALYNIQNEFQQILENKQTSHRTQCQNNADPELARHRIRLLFQNQDTDSLRGLIAGMEIMTREDIKPVRYLARGYLAELEQNYPLALHEYQQVLETSSDRTTETALRRIASLSLHLNDRQNALLALVCLTEHSPVYLSQYADLAAILGQTKTALDAYADYLEHCPDDPVVLLKVGKIYQKIGQGEFASSVFNHILQIDPLNDSAKIALNSLTN